MTRVFNNRGEKKTKGRLRAEIPWCKRVKNKRGEKAKPRKGLGPRYLGAGKMRKLEPRLAKNDRTSNLSGTRSKPSRAITPRKA